MRVPVGAVECPKCGTKNLLRLRYFVHDETAEETMRGTCSRCGRHRDYKPLDWKGNDGD